MPDVRFVRARSGARIYLYPCDVKDVVIQPEMLTQFTEEEIHVMMVSLSAELQSREVKENGRIG